MSNFYYINEKNEKEIGLEFFQNFHIAWKEVK
jgi:hypothetical protein